METKELFAKWMKNEMGMPPEPEPESQPPQDNYPCVKDGGNVLAGMPPEPLSPGKQLEYYLLKNGF